MTNSTALELDEVVLEQRAFSWWTRDGWTPFTIWVRCANWPGNAVWQFGMIAVSPSRLNAAARATTVPLGRGVVVVPDLLPELLTTEVRRWIDLLNELTASDGTVGFELLRRLAVGEEDASWTVFNQNERTDGD